MAQKMSDHVPNTRLERKGVRSDAVVHGEDLKLHLCRLVCQTRSARALRARHVQDLSRYTRLLPDASSYGQYGLERAAVRVSIRPMKRALLSHDQSCTFRQEEATVAQAAARRYEHCRRRSVSIWSTTRRRFRPHLSYPSSKLIARQSRVRRDLTSRPRLRSGAGDVRPTIHS